jgi:hypothetical protein
MGEVMDALGRREEQLRADGADPLRLELLRRARRFKRSWIDMAEALVELRVNRSYESWGYADFYEYCAEELLIKRRTVDKLTGTFSTLEQHAPELLRGGDDQRIPTFDSVDYFARAMGANEGGRAPAPEVLDELRAAVFEEGKPVTSLRRQFNSVLFAKSEPEQALEALSRAQSTAERLAGMLGDVPGLSPVRAADVSAALVGLRAELGTLIEEAQARAARRSA